MAIMNSTFVDTRDYVGCAVALFLCVVAFVRLVIVEVLCCRPLTLIAVAVRNFQRNGEHISANRWLLAI